MAPVFFHHGEPTDVHGFLCQWYKSDFVVDGQKFNCAEQWMMWNKAMAFGDERTAKEVLGMYFDFLLTIEH